MNIYVCFLQLLAVICENQAWLYPFSIKQHTTWTSPNIIWQETDSKTTDQLWIVWFHCIFIPTQYCIYNFKTANLANLKKQTKKQKTTTSTGPKVTSPPSASQHKHSYSTCWVQRLYRDVLNQIYINVLHCVCSYLTNKIIIIQYIQQFYLINRNIREYDLKGSSLPQRRETTNK